LNSKRVDDEHLEAELEIALRVDAEQEITRLNGSEDKDSQLVTSVADLEISPEHEHDGKDRFCAVKSSGVVNCSQCIREVLKTVPEEAFILYGALDRLGASGCSKSVLNTLRAQLPVDSNSLKALRKAKPPLVHWVGYNEALLVSSSHIRGWGVVLSDQLILPRRWIDIFGNEMRDIWEASCRAVVGFVLMRPGITEADLRHRLDLVYDRGDLNDVINFLVDSRIIRKFIVSTESNTLEELAPETHVHFLVGSRGPWGIK